MGALWLALAAHALEPTEAGEAPEEVPDAVPAPLPDARADAGPPAPTTWVGGEVGGTMPIGSPLGAGGLVRVEVGGRLNAGGGRFQPLVSVGYAIATGHGQVTDPVSGATWAWTVLDHQFVFASGFSVRVKPAEVARSAEVVLLPELVVGRSHETTSRGEALGGTATDGGLRGGGTLAIGMTGRRPDGSELIGRAGVRVVAYDGELTGAHAATSLVLTVGMRHAL